MNFKLRDRRQEMLRMHYLGVPITAIAENLAKKYKVSPRTITSDFTRRDSWMVDLAGNPETQAFMTELLGGIKLARNQGWRILTSAHTSDNAKVAVLSVMDKSFTLEVELLQSLGRLPKMPTQLQQEIIGTQKIIVEDLTESESACLNRAARILDEKVKKSYMPKDKDETEDLH